MTMKNDPLMPTDEVGIREYKARIAELEASAKAFEEKRKADRIAALKSGEAKFANSQTLDQATVKTGEKAEAGDNRAGMVKLAMDMGTSVDKLKTQKAEDEAKQKKIHENTQIISGRPQQDVSFRTLATILAENPKNAIDPKTSPETVGAMKFLVGKDEKESLSPHDLAICQLAIRQQMPGIGGIDNEANAVAFARNNDLIDNEANAVAFARNNDLKADQKSFQLVQMSPEQYKKLSETMDEKSRQRAAVTPGQVKQRKMGLD